MLLNAGMTAPPLVTCVTTLSYGGFSWSRFGPTVPVAPASANVWQPLQPAEPVKTVLPAAAFPAGAGVVVVDVDVDVVGAGVVVDVEVDVEVVAAGVVLPETVCGEGVASSSPPHPAATRPTTAKSIASPHAVRRIAPILYAPLAGASAQPCASDGGRMTLQRLELEGEKELRDAAHEGDEPHVDHEQDRLLAEVPGDPEGEQDLDDPRDQL